MKKIVLISIGIIVIVFIVFYSIYVIPYGLKQDSNDKEFKIFQNSVSVLKSRLSKGLKIDTFISCIDQFLLLQNDLIIIDKKFITIEKQRNGIRNNLWSKPIYVMADIEKVNSDFQNIYEQIPKYLTNSIVGTSNNIINLETVLPIRNYYQKLNEYKSKLSHLNDKLVYLGTNYNDTIKLNQNDIEIILNTTSNVITNATKFYSTERNNRFNSIKNSESMSAINQHIKSLNSYLKDYNNLLVVANNIGTDNKLIINGKSIIDKDVKALNAAANLLNSVVVAQKNSNGLLKNALISMDNANDNLTRMEKFASSNDILSVYKSWVKAEGMVIRSKNPLYYKGSSSTNKTIWNNLNRKALSNIKKIQIDVSKHKQFVHNEYSKAVKEESTYLGYTQRTVSRGWNRLKKATNKYVNQAKSSRIAKELTVSAKVLILGTKAFYDLQNPDTDVITWALSYSDEVDDIMKETEEIQRMAGPSLTGKNTIIESLTSQAFDYAFHEGNSDVVVNKEIKSSNTLNYQDIAVSNEDNEFVEDKIEITNIDLNEKKLGTEDVSINRREELQEEKSFNN